MKRGKNGFTLAELLIVVAIIAVLVAISIPIFTSQLKKARLAVDHSAIRDAYALVQIANNLAEVEIDGVTKTFDKLDDELEYGHMTYYLSEDCSSLLTYLGGNFYFLREEGDDGSGTCPVCEQWDNVPSGYTPISKMHHKDYPIAVIYDKSLHQMYLGVVS